MIYDYITTKPPLDENTMHEYGLTYLEHGRMKGWAAAAHKYLDRVWKNGKWVYKYAKNAGTGALKTAKSTAKNFTKSLSKSTNSGLKRISSMMDGIRKKYGNGQAKATAKNALNTAKKEGKYLATKTKNAAKKTVDNVKKKNYVERAKGTIRNKVGKTDYHMINKNDRGGSRETDDNSAYVKKNTNPLTNARKKKKYAETYKKNKYRIESERRSNASSKNLRAKGHDQSMHATVSGYADREGKVWEIGGPSNKANSQKGGANQYYYYNAGRKTEGITAGRARKRTKKVRGN